MTTRHTPPRTGSLAWRLRADEGGSAGLSLVYVIMSVIIISVFAGALFTAAMVTQRNTALREVSAAAKSAIVLMEAELAMKAPEVVASEMAAGGAAYRPAAAVGAVPEMIRFNGVQIVNADTVRVTVTVTSPVKSVGARTIVTEFKPQRMVKSGGVWVPASPGDTEVWMQWQAVRTINEGAL